MDLLKMTLFAENPYLILIVILKMSIFDVFHEISLFFVIFRTPLVYGDFHCF